MAMTRLPKLTLPPPFKKKPLNIRTLLNSKLMGMIKSGAFKKMPVVK